MAGLDIKHHARGQTRYLLSELCLVFVSGLYLAFDLSQGYADQTLPLNLALTLGSLLLLSLSGIALAWRVTRGQFDPLRLALGAARNARGHPAQNEAAVITHAEFSSITGALRELSETNQRLEKLVHTDELTGLPNRSRFEAALNAALAGASGSVTALLLIDMDQLRYINEAYGYRFGDACLSESARRLNTTLNGTASCYRHGAGLFSVLLTGLPPVQAREKAAALADQLRRALAQPHVQDTQRVMLSASLGVALAPGDGDNLGELMGAADAALLRAKKAGRNNVQFANRDLAQRARRRLDMADDLRRALHNNALHPYYQPIVNVMTGRLSSVEMLCRWPQLGRGFVPPDDFIRVAEETGQLDTLSQHLLKITFEDAARWQRTERAVRVAVNLSAHQLRPDFIGALMQELERSGLSPRQVDIEITESSFIEKPDQVEQILREVKLAGLGVCLDDFGTGYSSLSYLQRLPIDKLKIDKSFVQKLGKTQQADRIVAATAVLANSLGIALVGEGVETLEQLIQLRDLGCHLHQGYYFSRALPAVEFEAWMKRPLPPLYETQHASAAA